MARFKQTSAPSGSASADVTKTSATSSGLFSITPAAGSLPLSQRPVDQLLVAWWAIFWFTVMFTDLHNFTASVNGMTVQQLEPWLEKRPNRFWPPPVLTYLYYRWARTVDPLLYSNPVWWQCIEWVNLLCLMPFSVWAGWAFAKGSRAIVKPAFIVQAFTFYSLIMCIGSTLFGPQPSEDGIMFTAIYVPYLLMPALVVARLWPAAESNPFATPLARGYESFLYYAISGVFLVFASYVLKWFVHCEPGMLGPLLPLVKSAGALPGLDRCPATAV